MTTLPDAVPPPSPALDARALIALILGQICLHSCMTGVRVEDRSFGSDEDRQAGRAECPQGAPGAAQVAQGTDHRGADSV